MFIKSIHLKNFRCFQDFSLEFTHKLVLISGRNGSGKSSILEALHYGCYLRSFRTHIPRELIHFDTQNLFIKIDAEGSNFEIPWNHAIQVGFSGAKRMVKIDQKAIRSYKELIDFYRIITLTVDDLALIKGSPETRRTFLDQALALHNPDTIVALRRYRTILENRNALLAQRAWHDDQYLIWTQQLWEQSKLIQVQRIDLLERLQKRVNALLDEHFDQELTISMQYLPKNMAIQETFEEFLAAHPSMPLGESALGRSLFGAHLDDISIEFCNKTSRAFASRGQQKLTTVLLKIAQMQEIIAQKGPAILLLDDFMADFDPIRGEILLKIFISLDIQLIVTSPSHTSYFDQQLLLSQGAQHISLTD